jgi:drug/metabolite transporter (DMT)-like permease
VAFEGVPPGLGGRETVLLAVAGAGNVVGLLFAYAALRVGKIGVVAPIVSTQGAIGALIAILAGEQISPGAGLALSVVAVGIALAAATGEGDDRVTGGEGGRAALLAVAGAAALGASLYAMGRVGAELPLAWVLIPSRVLGVALVALPLAVRARLRITRRAVPLVVAAGVLELAGFGLFTLGARHGIAVSAVLASQFAAIAAVAAYVLFRERLTGAQIAGVALIAAGVAALSGLQALSG